MIPTTAANLTATQAPAAVRCEAHLHWLTLLTIAVNASAMLSPIIDSGDAVIYASISRHMALTHDWARLVLDGHDWLDKPHLPFWLTALSFGLGGVSASTYILPGFLFHLIGAYYTYRLACLLYDQPTARLSVLIYVSIFNLMDSSIEIKAEAYLRAEIMAACYYWCRYDRQGRIGSLLCGALFTGMAIMTKGIFSLWTVFSGFACLWWSQQQSAKWLSRKWLLALLLSLLAAAPELIALDVQFDPHTGAPWRFFFWDSQFGRFFNTGPIQNRSGHPLYYVFVLLWGFMPWTLLLVAAVRTHAQRLIQRPASERGAFVFLLSAFLCTFLLFSATRFQMSYYIDIILPFAAILCAQFVHRSMSGRSLFMAQMGLVSFIALLALGLSIYVMQTDMIVATAALCAGLSYYAYTTRAASMNFRVIAYSVLAINILYVLSIQLNASAFARFSVASYAGNLLGTQADIPIYVYQMPEVSRELALYSKAPSYALDSVESLARIQGGYYLIVRHDQATQLPLKPPLFRRLVSMNLVVHKTGSLAKLLRLAKGTWPLEPIDFLQYVP